MRILSVGVLFVCVATAAPVRACITDAEIVLEDVKYADTVVVGRIRNYKVVTPEGKKPGYIWDYARFEVVVDEALKGQAAGTLIVTWDNSTFGEPDELPPGQYLLALRNAESNVIPPLRGLSATVLPRPEPEAATLLQAPCASPFLFEGKSAEAAAVRKILRESNR